MKKEFHKVNRMPVRSWTWLGVNDADVTLPSPEDGAVVERPGPAPGGLEVRREVGPAEVPGDPADPFVPEEMAAFFNAQERCRLHVRVPRDLAEKDPLVLVFRSAGEGGALMDDIVIEAEEGSSATVILRYLSGGGGPAHHGGRTRVLAHRNARVTLVKVQTLDGEADHADAVGCVLDEGAFLHVIIAEMGAGRSVTSCNVILEGKGSRADLDVLYLGDAARSLDMSYRVEHRGRGTVSAIRARGILAGRSRKVLRDTLDFVSGASGSKGREEETVLMLSPQASNVSVPLLLCGEDDVEGEHAASSGRPDERTLFYLMSRGIGEADSKRMLAQAMFSTIVEKIPDAGTRDDILARVSASIAGE